MDKLPGWLKYGIYLLGGAFLLNDILDERKMEPKIEPQVATKIAYVNEALYERFGPELTELIHNHGKRVYIYRFFHRHVRVENATGKPIDFEHSGWEFDVNGDKIPDLVYPYYFRKLNKTVTFVREGLGKEKYKEYCPKDLGELVDTYHLIDN